MFRESVTNKIPVISIFVLVVCVVMNHYIKEKAFEKSVDETLVKNCMVGAYMKVSKDDLGYVICTEDNIQDIVITDKLVHLGLFKKMILVDVDVTFHSGGKIIKIKGHLTLMYDKNAKKKWHVDSRYLEEENAMIYE